MRTKRNSSANPLVQAKRPRYDAQVVPSLDASENVEDSELASKVCLKNIPRSGTPVNRKVMKRAGQYILGPKLGNGPVESIAQYLARKENTGDYYQLKVRKITSGLSKHPQLNKFFPLFRFSCSTPIRAVLNP